MNVLLPLYALKQNDEKLRLSSLGLIAELALVPEVKFGIYEKIVSDSSNLIIRYEFHRRATELCSTTDNAIMYGLVKAVLLKVSKRGRSP